jgi:hypothetical protein
LVLGAAVPDYGAGFAAGEVGLLVAYCAAFEKTVGDVEFDAGVLSLEILG